ncbi:MAG: serine/threonine protein kinase [Phycisphaerae bacterium]|nr:serine/threonine protein kinase [Phycisphaerae bacterium]
MASDKSDRTRELFLAACQITADERAEFLRRACENDSDLLREVESLLAFDKTDESFLRTPIIAAAAGVSLREKLEPAEPDRTNPETDSAALNQSNTSRATPQHIGRYRIVGVLGEGGMGIVYRAEQDRPRRTVALKIIKPGAESQELLKRFSQESHVLGWLQHPGIAQIYEAGTADTGHGIQPYFAMELIDGEPLLSHVRAGAMETSERLAIHAMICDAVHHAHQKGVIHRDLKPANILVDRAGQPKILDFGVARATDADVRTTTLQTDPGKLIGTIAYMSPEQIAGDARFLDTRSDIYALGVILYEMLAGRLPHDVSAVSVPQAARIITDEEPTSLTALDRRYRGDLTTIVSKALEKDKERRYQSAHDLASDIRRFLADEPIAARRPTAAYQLRKFACRNKVLVIGVGATFVALLSGVVSVSFLATRLAGERDRARAAERIADRQREQATRQMELTQSINRFLNEDLLAAVSPERLGKDVRMRDVLDAAAKNMEGKFVNDPAIEGELRTTLGNTYKKLGLYEEAEIQLRRALEVARSRLGETHTRTLIAMNNLAILYRLQGRISDAGPLLETVWRIRVDHLGEDHTDTLVSMNNLANQYADQRRFGEAESLYIRTMDIRRKLLGDDHPDTLLVTNNLAAMYENWGKYERAEPLYEAALAARRRLYGDEHPDTLVSMNNLAVLYFNLQRYDEAEALYATAVELRRRILGEEHPRTLASQANLAILWRQTGRTEEARVLMRQTLDLQLDVLGDEHPDTLNTMNSLAVIHQSLGQFDEAERLYTHVLDRRRMQLGDNDPLTQLSMTNLAVLLYNYTGRPSEAEPLLVRLLDICRRQWGEDHPRTKRAKQLLLGVYKGLGDWDKARPLVAEVMADLRSQATLPDASPFAANAYAWELLTSPVEDLRDPETALYYAQLAVEGSQAGNAGILDTLALAQHMTGDSTTAIETIKRAIAILPPGPSADRSDFEASLVRYLIAGKRFEEAESLLLARYADSGSGIEKTDSGDQASKHQLIDLYDAWHVSDPSGGFDKKANALR